MMFNGHLCELFILITRTHDLFIIKEFENEKIISWIVGISDDCDQSGDRVSKNDQSCYISINLY